MKPGSRSIARPLVAACALATVAGACRLDGPSAGDASAEDAPPAYVPVALPEGLDSLSSLEEAADRIGACGAGCAHVVYVWTPRMPLSRSGIPNVARAARDVGAELTLIGFEELERFAEAEEAGDRAAAELGKTLLAAGALAHAPALAVHDGERVVGAAILGYKTADAYESMIAARLSAVTSDGSSGALAPGGEAMADPAAGAAPRREGAQAGGPALPAAVDAGDAGAPALRAVTDYGAVGVPGAYFRWVPGRRAVAYESDRRIYLLDLDDGASRPAPGTIDFVPTPDGRYFVTPGPRAVGLAFYDADGVFEAARSGRTADVRPIFADGQMRDQYPSVGILESGESSVRYRVLTSWFEGLRYRDYEVVHAQGRAGATVRPLGPPAVPCEGTALSTPIMSQDGLEVAARDEASGTTKIYRILEDGRCDEVLALGMPTRKVAWHANGRLLAFSTPRVRTATSGGMEPGIFVFDRDDGSLMRVTDSAGASQLAFPDFVGDDAIVFMVPGRSRGELSHFRLVEPLP